MIQRSHNLLSVYVRIADLLLFGAEYLFQQISSSLSPPCSNRSSIAILLPRNTPPERRSILQESEACRTSDYYDHSSNQKEQIEQFPFLLQLRMLFCYFYLITQQIFHTKLTPPYFSIPIESTTEM